MESLTGETVRLIIKNIEKTSPILAKRISEDSVLIQSNFPIQHLQMIEWLLSFLEAKGKTLDYAVECFLKKSEDLTEEQLKFFRTYKYSRTSFAQVNQEIYNNPKIMQYHTIGLLMQEILYFGYYQKLQFLIDNLQMLHDKIYSYLEIGGGHGMYVLQAAKLLSKDLKIDLVDISETSISIAKTFLHDIPVNYFQKDIFSFTPSKSYDFISMSEILEHVEKPGELIAKAKTLLKKEGYVFVSIPINNPAIDHIYLFESVDHARHLLLENNFAIVNEGSITVGGMSINEAEKRKLPIDYFALLRSAQL